MNIEPIIRNKIAESGIITIDLASYAPQGDIVLLDLKDYLFMGMILKEKDFRAALKEQDWRPFTNKIVGIVCTADAIIPLWAYMLLVTYLQPAAKFVTVGDIDEVKKKAQLAAIEAIDLTAFEGARIVIKGCGDLSIGADVYAAITSKLLPVAKSIMYGEPCSTVPVYKKK